MNWYHRNLGTILIAFTLVTTIPSLGLTEEQARCRSGEYVVTVSSVDALKTKTVEDLNQLTDNPLTIKAESSRALLISQKLRSSALVSQSEEVSAEEGSAFCNHIRRGKREQRRLGRQHQKSTVVRAVSCSCNAVLKGFVEGQPQFSNDQHLSLQWGLNQANNIDIDAPEAWGNNQGNKNIIVAVIDSGVQYNHPDLISNMWKNPGEIAGDGLDNDQNGLIDDVYGARFSNNGATRTGDPMDDNGHGTHCAGIIGAKGNNSIGVAGVNWNISIMGVKFLGADGGGSLYDAVLAIDYVRTMKERGENIVVSNNSWGSTGSTWGPLGDAIMRHQNAGILFVAAAGNSSLNTDVSASSPSSFGADSILAVAAIDKNGAMASFSNYGKTTVDIGAPGVDIASTYIGNQYKYLSGTSMAAPMVSGAAALLSAIYPGITWSQMKQILMSSGKPLSALTNTTVSGKMLNINSAIGVAGNFPVVTPTPQPTPTMTPTPTRTPTPVPTMTPTATPTLAPGYWVVSGMIRDISGNPIPNAFVRVVTVSGTQVRQSDATGMYRFPGIFTSQTLTVSAEAEGYQFQPFSASLTHDRTVDFTSQSLNFSLKAKIITTSGSPVSGLTIRDDVFGSGVTNAQGYVNFTLPHGTSYSLQALSTSPWIVSDPRRQGTVTGDIERVWVATQ